MSKPILWGAVLAATAAWLGIGPAALAAEGGKPPMISKPTPEQVAWQDAEMGMFFHFDIPVFVEGGDAAKQAEYARICERMVSELWGNYGGLFYVWFDGGALPPDKGGPDLVPILKKLQPHAVCFQGPPDSPAGNTRWPGNESGVTAYPTWATVAHSGDGGDGDPNGKIWQPGECDAPLRKHDWFWHPKSEQKIRSVEELVGMYYQSVGRNSNLILNGNIDRRGLVPEADMKRFKEFGDEIRRRFGKSLVETQGKGEVVELTLDKPTLIDHVIIMEQIAEGERIRQYVVEGMAAGQWQTLCKGQSVGHKRIERFDPTAVSNDNAQHDVYNAGAMIEAAVHCWRATGKTRLLVTAMKLANHMCDVMGPPPKRNVVPGHSLGEEAMVKLYLVLKEHPELKEGLPFAVDETRYLKLVEFWIENRGNHEGRIDFGSYGQDHMPVLRQPTIEGHAVRATLLCTGLVAAAGVNHRDDYYQAARRLWDNMVQRRMHVTGGVGAVAGYEGFGPDYVLPNSAYLETCAAIGAGFFHHNMNLAFADARYADELERVLFNGALAGASLKGDTYSYENPLEAMKKRTRWAWHGCPCCPPMFLKIMAAMPGYVYATDRDGIYVNLFAGSRATVALAGSQVVFTQTTRYPWEGSVRIAVEPAKEAEFALYLRIPAWCDGAALKANGEKVARLEMARGYACIRRTWRKGDVVDLDMPMPVRRIKAHPSIQADVGRVALARGPIIYCLEEADNGRRVRHLAIPPDVRLAAKHRPDLLGGVTVIKGGAVLRVRETTERPLYLAADKRTDLRSAEFVAIPYYANTNRQPGAMLVWAPESPDLAEPMPPPTIAGEATPSASHCNPTDDVAAMNDGVEPKDSADESVPRLTWWAHRGTKEWVQYDFDKPRTVSAVEVYWWDETRIKRHCRVPQAWRLLYRDAEAWKPVARASEFGTRPDQFNRVTFEPVGTTALRIEVQLQPEWSGGILEWRVEGR